MRTWARAATRPGHGAARTALVVGLTAVLVVGLSLAARDPRDVLSSTDLDRIEDAVDQGCPDPTGPLVDGTGYALDGTVVDVVAPPGRSPVRVTLRVREWFVGPPLETVEVWVDPTTARDLDVADRGTALGERLLVSGRGWEGSDTALVAAGCGRTRAWGTSTAADWRRSLGRPDPEAAEGPAGRVGPVGPVATYPSVGFVRPVREPDLRGVAVVDAGCLYVQDGRTRWVPVLPSALTTWQGTPPAVGLAGVATDVGHVVRLAGLPAGGLVPRGADGTDPSDTAARVVDPAGVPEACDPAAPRFVVAEPAGPVVPPPTAGSAPVGVTQRAARRAGLRPTVTDGRLVTDQFGATSSRVVVGTVGGDVVVHVESVALPAWPHAYAPRDATLAFSGDPDGAAGLPRVPPGCELAVVTRADDMTQVLLRTPGRVVVSVGADASTLAVPEAQAVQALTEVAVDVAGLSPAGGGS